jgi:phosphatidylinositol-3-phosphatase
MGSLRWGRRAVTAALAAAVLLGLAPGIAGALPPVRHVFVIVLENEDESSTFGAATKAPYLAHTLASQGQVIPNFYGVTHQSLGNYIALVSGQGSNVDTQADCQFYQDITPGTIGPDSQAMGQGCVYPATVKTIADQLTDKSLSWKGYMEDMGNTPGQPSTCRHPALNSQDQTQNAKPSDQYAARHDPFVYFHSILDSPLCNQNVVPLDRLPGDLQSPATTGSYVFITPNLCHDGHDEPCVNGEPGGLVSADRFLQRWIPAIQGSPAYRQGGLIVITFDEAETHDATACCNEPPFPNTPNNGGPTMGQGGGRIGAVVLSPFVRAGSVNQTPYNHFSLLRSVEDLFGLSHLGFSARPDLRAFGSDVFDPGPVSLTDFRLRANVFRSARTGSSVSRRRKRKRKPLGTTASFKVSQPSVVTFRVQQRVRGRVQAARCTRSRRHRRGRSCIHWVTVRGSFDQQAVTGENSFRFRGRLPGRRLRVGRYRLLATAEGFGGRSRQTTRRFRIVLR